MYIYFNNEGALTTIIPHGEEIAVRQGSTFNVHVLFETDCPYLVQDGNAIDSSALYIKFKKNGEDFFGEDRPLTQQSDYVFHKNSSNELTFDLKEGKTYIHYLYEGSQYDSSKYGQLYGVVTIYAPIENVVLEGNAIIGDAGSRDIKTTGLISIYIEKTTGTATIPSVSPDQYAYLMALAGTIWNRIASGTGEVNINNLKVKTIDDDLIPKTDDTYHIGSETNNWLDLWLKNGKITIEANDHLKINNFDYKTAIELINTEVFGSSTGQETPNGLKYIIRDPNNGIDSRITRLEAEVGPQTNFGSNTLRGRMQTAEDDIDSLEGRMDTAESDIDSLEGRMDTAESDIDSLEEAVGTDNTAGTIKGRIKVLEGQRPGYIKLTSDSGTLTASQILELAQPDCVIEYDDNYYQWTIKGTVNKFTYVQRQSPANTPNVFIIKTIEINSSYQYSMNSTTYSILGTNMVVDDVTTDSPTKVLSAKQGKYLKGLIDDIVSDIGVYTDSVGAGTIKSKLTYLQSQIDGINAGQNLVDIVATKSALLNLSTTNIKTNDKVQVLADESVDVTNPPSTVYNWNGSSWTYIGPYGQDSYSKSETDNLLDFKADKSTTYTKTETDNTFVKQTDVVAVTNAEIDNLFL